MSVSTQQTEAGNTTLANNERQTEFPGVAIGVTVGALLVIIAIVIFLIVRRYRKNKELKDSLDGISTGSRRDSLFDPHEGTCDHATHQHVQTLSQDARFHGIDNSGFYQMKETKNSVVKISSQTILPKNAIFKKDGYRSDNPEQELENSTNYGISGGENTEDATFVY